jgi:hypothetical protein
MPRRGSASQGQYSRHAYASHTPLQKLEGATLAMQAVPPCLFRSALAELRYRPYPCLILDGVTLHNLANSLSAAARNCH